jgi:hypothetical protein
MQPELTVFVSYAVRVMPHAAPMSRDPLVTRAAFVTCAILSILPAVRCMLCMLCCYVHVSLSLLLYDDDLCLPSWSQPSHQRNTEAVRITAHGVDAVSCLTCGHCIAQIFANHHLDPGWEGAAGAPPQHGAHSVTLLGGEPDNFISKIAVGPSDGCTECVARLVEERAAMLRRRDRPRPNMSSVKPSFT